MTDLSDASGAKKTSLSSWTFEIAKQLFFESNPDSSIAVRQESK